MLALIRSGSWRHRRAIIFIVASIPPLILNDYCLVISSVADPPMANFPLLGLFFPDFPDMPAASQLHERKTCPQGGADGRGRGNQYGDTDAVRAACEAGAAI